jgi:hypothetical protein
MPAGSLSEVPMPEPPLLDEKNRVRDKNTETPVQEPKEPGEKGVGKSAIASKVAVAISFVMMLITGGHTLIYWNATKVENRAYIVLKGFEIPSWKSAGDTIQVTAVLTNVGRTPAYYVSQYNELFFDSVERVAEYHRQIMDTGHTIGSNIDYPISSKLEVAITPFMLDAIKSGRAILFFYVSVTYRDIFGSSHRTVIFTKYDAGMNSFVGARGHNYAD